MKLSKEKPAVYAMLCTDTEAAKELIQTISPSAKQSIEMGGPGDHGGFTIREKDSACFLALTSGGVLYGHVGNYAILGYYRKGSLSVKLRKSGWRKTEKFNWIYNVPFSGSENIIIDARINPVEFLAEGITASTNKWGRKSSVESLDY
jgi:hypothetical protein